MQQIQTMLRIAILLLSGLAYTAAVDAREADKTTIPARASGQGAPQNVMAIDDRVVFETNYPHARRVDLAGASGKTAPFYVGRVRFSGGFAQVMDMLVDLPADFWFGSQTTSPDFLLSNLTVQITFPHPVQAMGFDLQCFACDLAGQPTPFTAILLGEDGGVVDYQEEYSVTLTGDPQSTPAFVGFDSDVPFKSIVLHRDGNWLMANLRYMPSERDINVSN